MQISDSTPLIEVDGVLAKLECLNATGSVKDRIAGYILRRSRELGLLQPGQTIVEATSGNTGIALSRVASEMGHPVIIVMPENMTEERKRLIRENGAELILCSKEGSFEEAAQIRDSLAKEHGYFNPDQFSNPLNVECHERTTGQEILAQVEGRRIDAFVAGIGTGGTLIGVGKALRAKFPDVHIAAVEPAESAVMTGGTHNPHGIYGIGDGFIPPIASNGEGGRHPMIDEVIVIPTEDAVAAAKELAKEYGYCVGVSSGANFLAARKLKERFETVVTVFADGYWKYSAQGLRKCNEKMCPYQAHCH